MGAAECEAQLQTGIAVNIVNAAAIGPRDTVGYESVC